MPNLDINQFANGTGLLVATTNFAVQQAAGGSGSTQYMPFSEIVSYIDQPLAPITITSGSQNLTFDTDVYFINNSGPGIYTLPFASGNGGRRITIKKLSGSAFPIIIDPQSGESIDPAATFPVAQQYISITFYSDGISTWWVI